MKHVPYSCELSYNSYVEAFIQNFKWETSLLVIWCSPICVVTPVRLQNKALFLSRALFLTPKQKIHVSNAQLCLDGVDG